MQKCIAHFKKQVKGINGPDSHLAIIDSLKIENYGQVCHLSQTVKRDRAISIFPYDNNLIPAILRECKKSGFDAFQFSKQEIKVNLPAPSGDARKEQIKKIKGLAEEARVSVRNVRKKFKKQVDLKDLQKITDESIREIDEILKLKIKILLE